jgi:cellulose synthase/poly-beta-1,6-N-acetylglucosamine synthase-like glycosyltransferase
MKIKTKGTKEKYPFFSIIVPTYNRPRQIFLCLQALSIINYPHPRFEVIVVDDGSRLPVQTHISPFFDKMNLTVITQENAGPSMARNVGAKSAKGDFLAFTDDDCMPASDWLQTLSLRFKVSPGCAIVGRSVNALEENVYDTASQMLIEYLHAYYNHEHNQARFITSNNLSLPTKQFEAVGGFDTFFSKAGGEDREFCEHLRYHGYQIIYAPEVVVHHSHGLTFSSFWRQHFNYGRGAFLFRQKCFHNRRQCIKLEPMAFYLKLLSYPSSRNRKHPGLWLSALLLLSQGANASGYLSKGIKHRC